MGKIDENTKYLSLYFGCLPNSPIFARLVRPMTTRVIIRTVPVSTQKEIRFKVLQVSVGHHSFLRLFCLALQSIG